MSRVERGRSRRGGWDQLAFDFFCQVGSVGFMPTWSGFFAMGGWWSKREKDGGVVGPCGGEGG